MKTELLESVKNIDAALFKELIDEQEALVKAYYGKDFEKVLLKAGKFYETLFQIFEYLQNGSFSQQPNMNKIETELENMPKDSVPESIRTILPRLGKAVYSVRSKRGGGHKTPIPPLEIDAYLCLNTTKYVISELMRLYSDLPDKKVAAYVRAYMRPKLPFIEEFENGELVILIDTDSCKDKLLLLLYHLYPGRTLIDDLKKHLKDESPQNVTSSLAYAEKQRLVHRNGNGWILTEKGIQYIEETFGNHMKDIS